MGPLGLGSFTELVAFTLSFFTQTPCQLSAAPRGWALPGPAVEGLETRKPAAAPIRAPRGSLVLLLALLPRGSPPLQMEVTVLVSALLPLVTHEDLFPSLETREAPHPS